MTEPKPQWTPGVDTTEAEMQIAVIERLRGAGWLCAVDCRDRRDGLPGVLAFKGNCTLLVECRSPRRRRREPQVTFWGKLLPHLGDNLRYAVVRHPAQIEEWLKCSS
jgi:hypothetical protein